MSGVRRHAVEKLLRTDASFALPDLADFELGPAETVDRRVLSRRDLAPWGLDVASGSVILLDFADAAALRGATFLYQAQARQATEVILAPYADFCAAYPDGREQVFLHSVGRCGSTLLAHQLAQLPGVCCLSEPDIYSAVLSAGLDAELAIPLLRAATNALIAALAGDDLLVVKTRSEVCRIWPLLGDGRAIFLYRDAADVVQSFDRVLGYPHGRTQGHPERAALFERQLPAYEAALRTRFFARGSPHLARAQAECGPWAGLLLAEWLDKVDAYRAARGPVFALRYEDLVAHPSEVLRNLAGFLGRDRPSEITLPTEDSQGGTLLESVETLEHPLDDATREGIARVAGAGRLPGSWAPGT